MSHSISKITAMCSLGEWGKCDMDTAVPRTITAHLLDNQGVCGIGSGRNDDRRKKIIVYVHPQVTDVTVLLRGVSIVPSSIVARVILTNSIDSRRTSPP